MRNLWLGLVVMAISALCWQLAAAAEYKVVTDFKAKAAKSAGEMAKAEAALKAADEDSWTDAMLDSYLRAMGWTIYDSMMAYSFDREALPAGLDELKTYGLPAVPGNPLNCWEPIALLELCDGYSPGDIVLQLAPPEYYSFAKDAAGATVLLPLSFQLAVYASDPAATSLDPESIVPENDWAVLPQGVTFMVGTYSESAVSSYVKQGKQLRELMKLDQQPAAAKP